MDVTREEEGQRVTLDKKGRCDSILILCQLVLVKIW